MFPPPIALQKSCRTALKQKTAVPFKLRPAIALAQSISRGEIPQVGQINSAIALFKKLPDPKHPLRQLLGGDVGLKYFKQMQSMAIAQALKSPIIEGEIVEKPMAITLAPRTDDATPAKKILKFDDFDLGVQYIPGDERHGKILTMGYGHIRGTKGEDGMALDCYIHPKVIAGERDPEDFPLFQVTQLKDGEFDEAKIFIGWKDAGKAEKAYKKAMPREMFGGIEEIEVADIDATRTDSDEEDGERADAFPTIKRKLQVGDVTISITHDPDEQRFEYGLPMRAHYGYVEGTYGHAEDGKAFDVYINPGFDPAVETPLYRILQTEPSGLFDESKFMLGYPDVQSARDAHIYHVGSDRSGVVVDADYDELWPDSDDEDEGGDD
jgi:inorganic pyrophosphatase